jgi:inhibitor of cysteine peptidase
MIFFKNKKTVAFVVLFLLGGGMLFLTVSKKQPKLEKVQNFEGCLEAGYFLIPSHPRQCKTPDGQVFVEEKEEGERKTPEEEEVEVYTDPDQLIELQVGEKFQISLGSNPTTGYRWSFEADTNLVAPLKQEFRPESDLLGAGGKEIFEFSALNRGGGKIVFSYQRLWEKEVLKEKIFEVKIF